MIAFFLRMVLSASIPDSILIHSKEHEGTVKRLDKEESALLREIGRLYLTMHNQINKDIIDRILAFLPIKKETLKVLH